MAVEDKKYLDLNGLEKLVTKIKAEDDKRVPKDANASAITAALYKVGTNANGLVTSNTIEAVTKSDITNLGIPGQDTNQMIQAGETTFGANDTVKIVAGSNVQVVGNSSDKTITLSAPGNQTVKVGTTTFGENASIEFKAGDQLGIKVSTADNSITYKHDDSKTAASAGAVKVGRDKYGHVVLGDKLSASDIDGLGTGVLTIQTEGTTKGTFSANESTNKTINITAADLGLSGAMHFKGVLSSLPETKSYVAGDVILVDSKEYVLALNGTSGAKKWNELGDEGSHAYKNITISAGEGLTGGGDLSGDRIISHAKTTAVSAAAVKVGKDEFGHVVLGAALTTSVENSGVHTHTVSGSVSIPTVAPESTYIKAEATGTTVAGNGTANAVISVTPSVSKLSTTSIFGVGGTQTIKPAKAVAEASRPTRTVLGTSVKASKANAGTAITYGNANVSSTPQTVIKSVSIVSATDSSTSKQAFEATYNEASNCLELTPVTIHTSTTEILPAVKSTSTFVPYTFTDVNVPVITSNEAIAVATVDTDVEVATKAATATTVATGSVAVSGGGSDVIVGISTDKADVLTGVQVTKQPTITLSTSSSNVTGAVNVVNKVTLGTKTANLVNGEAAESGTHTHTVSIQ